MGGVHDHNWYCTSVPQIPAIIGATTQTEIKKSGTSNLDIFFNYFFLFYMINNLGYHGGQYSRDFQGANITLREEKTRRKPADLAGAMAWQEMCSAHAQSRL